MPLYEYECDRCHHRFEIIQKFSDPPVETCPKCGGPVHKLMSSPAIQFKGTGWYVTDYARSGSKDGKPSKDGGSKDKDTKAAGSGESKSETTTETKTEKPAAEKSSSSTPADTKTS